jgi:hypothetical protein
LLERLVAEYEAAVAATDGKRMASLERRIWLIESRLGRSA